MFSHIMIGVSDFNRATAFYTPVLQALGGLAHGGTCEGPPSLRPEYHAHDCGAYFLDPDGNKLCVACHGVEWLLSSAGQCVGVSGCGELIHKGCYAAHFL
jgi:catechol 2,3-dioxygenase-like lactoylglutathione lyase family enzyme